MKYKIIYADPPWRYNNRKVIRMDGRKPRFGFGAINHYRLMSTDDICALDVKSIADKDSALFLWATFPRLDEAFNVIDAWGFDYKTLGFLWVKLNKNRANKPLLIPGDPTWLMEWLTYFGIGYYTKSNPEICLLGIRGKMRPINNDVSNVVYYPLGRHSEKPPVIRDRIVRLFGDLPRIELFARDSAPGWDVWGDEVTSNITLGRCEMPPKKPNIERIDRGQRNRDRSQDRSRDRGDASRGGRKEEK